MFLDLTTTVIRVADQADELDRAHVANNGRLCCYCGDRLVGIDICPKHLDDMPDEVPASEVGARLSALMAATIVRLGLEARP